MVLKRKCKICDNICKDKYCKYCSRECYLLDLRSHAVKEKVIKLCARCNKKETQFKSSKYCQECMHFLLEEVKSKEKIRKRQKSREYYYKNKDNKEYKSKKRIYLKYYQRRRVLSDQKHVISFRIRNYFLQALRKYSKDGKIKRSNLYGINMEEIINHLKPFPKDISKYHIDHIIPLSSFDLNNPIQISMAFSKDNLQWLPAKENISKGKKILPNTVGFKQMFSNY